MRLSEPDTAEAKPQEQAVENERDEHGGSYGAGHYAASLRAVQSATCLSASAISSNHASVMGLGLLASNSRFTSHAFLSSHEAHRPSLSRCCFSPQSLSPHLG